MPSVVALPLGLATFGSLGSGTFWPAGTIVTVCGSPVGNDRETVSPVLMERDSCDIANAPAGGTIGAVGFVLLVQAVKMSNASMMRAGKRVRRWFREPRPTRPEE